MLNLISGHDRPSDGEIRVGGANVGRLRSAEISRLRRRLGIVFQDFRLLEDRTAEENVAFALEVTGVAARAIPTKVMRALTQVGLASKARSLPKELSGGEQQRVAIARALVNEGLKPEFPWLPLSILNAREFYDHHFLFHVALLPFTFGDLRVGAKWAAAFFAALAFLAIWYLFHKQKVPYAWLWALVLLGISDAFLYRMSITRAQSISLGVLALAYLWLLEGKHKHLAILSFVYVWLYDAFPLMVALGVLHFVAVTLVERRFEFKPLLYITVGVLAGMILNPYFPDNLIFSYRHMLPKLADATSVRVGNEWYPPLFFWIFFHDLGEVEHMRTRMFFLFIVVELVIAMSFRSLKHSIFKAPPHKWLLLAIFWELVLAFGLIQIPALRETFGILLPTLTDLAVVTAISAVVLVSMVALKAVLRWQAARQNASTSP